MFELPSYPWQRQRCWLEPSTAGTNLHREQAAGSGTGNHSLLGRHFNSPHRSGTHFWETELNRNYLSYLDDHRIQGVAVLPASAYVEMALAATVEVFGAQRFVLKNIEFRKALFLPESGTRTLQLILSRGADGEASFHIYSCPGGVPHSDRSWTLHATGKVCLQPDNCIIASNTGHEGPTEMRARCPEMISGQDYYRKLRESGIDYGPYFQSITRLWQNNGEMAGEVQVTDAPEAASDGSAIRLAILDAGFQLFGAAVAAEATVSNRQEICLPTRIDQFRVCGRPGRGQVGHARVQHREANATTGDVQLLDEAGRVAVEIKGLRFEYLGEGAQRTAADNLDNCLYTFQWQPKELTAGITSAPASPVSWLIFADKGGVGDALSALLGARGERSILVTRGDSYKQIDGEHYRIRPERPEDIRRLFEASLRSDQPRCRGVLHLWSLDVVHPDETTVASLNAAQTLGCGSVLLLVQELARTESSDLPRLWLITRGAQAAGEQCSPVSVAQSPLWGLGRVIAQEHAALWGGLVDLDPGASERDAEAHQLSEEISQTDGEDQLAFRQGRRYVGRLVRYRPPATQATPAQWRTDSSYLISGGLGDLGLLVARWMVEQGARRLILLGRTRMPPRSNWSSVETGSRLARQIAAIRKLEIIGCMRASGAGRCSG